MDDELRKDIESLAVKIRNQNRYLKTYTLLSFIYTADIVNRYVELQLAREPIGQTGFNVLNNLVLHGGTMNPTKLSERIFRSKNAVTRTIDNLEKLKFVTREPLGKDRRTRSVSITREGLEFVKKAPAAKPKRTSSMVLEPLTDEQIKELSVSLKLIRKHLLTLLFNEHH